MNSLITISILAILVLYMGLYQAHKALLPVTLVGLLVALGFAIAEWETGAVPIYRHSNRDYHTDHAALEGIFRADK
jgi:NADH-quinone oxidoreductase subunit N